MKLLLTFLLTLALASAALAAPAQTSAPRWWKGNLHTHTLWSDGDSFPELTVAWYKNHGYDFLALSDHNILAQGPKWVNPAKSRFARGRGSLIVQEYLALFGPDWVEKRKVDEAFSSYLETLPANRRPPAGEAEIGDTLVRLKPLDEFRPFFEEPGSFLLIPSEEITAAFVVHVNATNIAEFIEPQRGEDVLETLRLNVDAVLEQRDRTGQSMFPHVNHPNFRWAVTAEDLARVDGLRFFEVYNGHPGTANTGDELRAGLDRMWDIILTQRLAELGLGVVFGLAVDDAHEIHAAPEVQVSKPGRGWVMVRSSFLTPEHIVRAMEAGDFYSSTGVSLRDFRSDGTALAVEIEPEAGVTYKTQFIGTRKDYDPRSEPVRDAEGQEIRTTRRYSPTIGTVLAEVEGTSPQYRFRGDELYVRAKVISSRPKVAAYGPGETHEAAWVQPVLPGSR